MPLVALSLTLTWGFYAFLKRRLPIGPNQGFTLEVAILLVPALAACSTARLEAIVGRQAPGIVVNRGPENDLIPS